MTNGKEKKFVFDTVDRNSESIALLCDNIFYFAELGMQEFETSGLMMELLEKAGFLDSRKIFPACRRVSSRPTVRASR